MFSSARADNPQRAKELFQEGTTYFDLGQFDKAIDAWQAGYRERPDPGFLYNIAQAYRLAGDANKAIFFYKGYLRNAPKAHNRADVEEKIAALQKKVEQDQAAKPAAPPPAVVTPPPPTTAPPPPAVVTPPPPTAAPPPPAFPAPPPVTEPPPAAPPAPPSYAPPIVRAEAPAAPPPEVAPRLDFGAAVGVDGWGSSVSGTAQPSFAFTLHAGYIVARSGGRHPIQFRLAGLFGYTLLTEAGNRDTFVSGLIVPTLFLGLSPRFAFFGELGVGALGIFGINSSSTLLAPPPDPKMKLSVNGGQGLAEIRPALGVQVQATPSVGFFAEAAIDYSPKGKYFYAPISRSELLIGLSLRALPR